MGLFDGRTVEVKFPKFSQLLNWEVELLPLDDPENCQRIIVKWRSKMRDSLCPIDVEEISVQNRLDDACDDRNWVVELGHFEEVSVDPVGDIQRPVRTEREEIVRCNCFCFARSLQHK